MNEAGNNPTPLDVDPKTLPVKLAEPVPNYKVVQHELKNDGATQLSLPEGSKLLDVHMVDSRYVIRTLEPIELTDDEFTDWELTIVPAALGSKLALPPHAEALKVRHGGIHFFAY